MGKRRMFNTTIVETDAFLDMPLSTQALYFHLGMAADDDGFVNPKRILRMVGANDDDLKVLLVKRFLLGFKSGVVVIKHWKINNFIRNDRYTATTYADELSTLLVNDINAYTELQKNTTEIPTITDTSTDDNTTGIPKDIPEVDPVEVREAKVSIDKVSNTTNVVLAEKPPIEYGKPEINDLFNYWQETTGMPIVAKLTANRRAASNLFNKLGLGKTKQLIDGVALTLEDRYAPRIADFCDLQTKTNELMLWGKKRKGAHEVAQF